MKKDSKKVKAKVEAKKDSFAGWVVIALIVAAMVAFIGYGTGYQTAYWDARDARMLELKEQRVVDNAAHKAERVAQALEWKREDDKAARDKIFKSLNGKIEALHALVEAREAVDKAKADRDKVIKDAIANACDL